MYSVYLIIVLGMLSAFGPFVIDMYLPAMPEMTRVFSTSVSSVQLGLTFCMVGLAVGQIIFGPLSDRYGRKPVLYFSLLLYIATGAIPLTAPTIAMIFASSLPEYKSVGAERE